MLAKPTDTSEYTTGLTISRPSSSVRAKASADQAPHLGSSVATSSRTQESTRVACSRTTRRVLLVTQQSHDLVSGHGRRRTATKSLRGPPAPRAAALPAHDPQGVAHFDHVDLVAGVQAVLLADLGGNGHLSLAVQSHRARPHYVLQVARNTS